MTQRIRQKIKEARAMNRLRELRVAASKTRSKPNRSIVEYVMRPHGGRQGTIDLSRCCDDHRIRAMVRAWDRLGLWQRRHTRISHLCQACGIDESEFFGKLVASLSSRGADVGPLLQRLLNGLASQASPAGTLARRTESREPEKPDYPRSESVPQFRSAADD